MGQIFAEFFFVTSVAVGAIANLEQETSDRLIHSMWEFAVTPAAEPTNNHAERTLRRAVLWRLIRRAVFVH